MVTVQAGVGAHELSFLPPDVWLWIMWTMWNVLRNPGYSMYIRPTMIATEEILGVGATKNAKLFVILR